MAQTQKGLAKGQDKRLGKAMAATALALTAMMAGASLTGQALAKDREVPYKPHDINSLKPSLIGPPTEVLVLGTTHLSGHDQVKPQSLDPVIDKLAAYAPTIITIEALSGEACKQVVEGRVIYEDVASHYCNPYVKLAIPAQEALGLSLYQAMDEIEKTLAKDPKTLTPAQHRRLAALFCAAGDPTSAVVQWLSLPEAERHAGDGLGEDFAAALTRRSGQQNEDMMIAARLAVKLGLQRVYPVDEHASDRVQDLSGPGFEEAITTMWKGLSGKSKVMDDLRTESEKMVTPAEALRFYQKMNSREAQLANLNTEWRSALQEPSAKRFGRQYMGWWETRNLRMVANIRQAFANQPGARVLVIVGNGHKVFFDHLLHQQHEVKVVDAAKVLQ